MKKAFIAAFPHTIPVLTGFSMIGITYGLLMQTKGYGTLWSVLMSAVAFCGSMQFVAITMLTMVFDPFMAFFMSVLVNARHLFFGLSLLEKYRGMGKIRAFLIYTLCDETFSINCSVTIPEGVSKKKFYFMVSFLDYSYWVIATFLGSMFGKIITFNTKGIEFAMTAFFVVLFMEQWKEQKNRFSCLLGVLATGFSLLLFGKKNLIIPAMIVMLAALLVRRKKLCI